jgi:hypothetical protein
MVLDEDLSFARLADIVFDQAEIVGLGFALRT